MTFGQLVIVTLIALIGPIGVVTIAYRRPTLKWTQLLLMGGVTMVPILALLAIQCLISRMTTVIVLGMLTGHILTHLDTD
ncbi:MAG: hypothetical protein ABEJ59_00010 [Halanaeroarchaeum sp.]